jgi:hypothetical protein
VQELAETQDTAPSPLSPVPLLGLGTIDQPAVEMPEPLRGTVSIGNAGFVSMMVRWAKISPDRDGWNETVIWHDAIGASAAQLVESIE